MLGAIIGDIVGSTREFHNIKTENFELVPPGSRFTDDTVMTLAVADWLITDPGHTPAGLAYCMRRLGRKYPHSGYGKHFKAWLLSEDAGPYGSYGNGSGMRVSPVGLYAESMEEALELARVSASVTHDHPEGIKGAQAIAAAVFLRRQWATAREIMEYIEGTFGYDLHIDLEAMRPFYGFDVTCQGSVPVAIRAFIDREDSALGTLRLAVSMGGDSDTLAAMALSISTALPPGWVPGPIPKEVVSMCRGLLTPELRRINDDFEELVRARNGW